MSARLDIAICAYRSRDRLLACLASLADAAPPGTAITVVDNDSGDGTVEAVRARFPEVTAVPAGANLGFGRATNIAIRQGTAPFVLALNPDTVVPPGALERLLEVLEAHPRVAVVGPRLVQEDGTFDHASRRSFPTILGALGQLTGLGRRRAGGPLAQYRAPEVDEGPVDAVNGAFMLMRRAALDEVGLFDERYWMYMEDLDLCYRLAQAGWQTWYEPSVEVLHVKGASSGRHRSARLNAAFYGGMLRFYRTHYAPRRSPLTTVAVVAGIGALLAWRVAVDNTCRLLQRRRDHR